MLIAKFGLIFIALVIQPGFSGLKSVAKVTKFEPLRDTTKKYQSSALVEMNVEKTLKSELMGNETKYVGKIWISGGLFRWENDSPEKSILIFDGQTIWNEQTPPADFPGPVQVAKAKVDKKNRSKILLSSLLGKTPIFDNFTVLKEKIDGDRITYFLEPKVKDVSLNELTLSLHAKDKTVLEISYKDDVGNLTSMKFTAVNFSKTTKNKDLFIYTPPKGSQVQNL
jgi:outer membrane lipoprotein carrier protein